MTLSNHSSPQELSEFIHVRNARTHNLKNLDLQIPRNRLVVISGVSGSGKSSLAFDTLFAEGQRRYLESLMVGRRQPLPQLPRPPVDEIDGLPPTLSVRQGGPPANRRSTLATLTEIADYLRLIYAYAGTAHCPKCSAVITRHTSRQIVEEVASWQPRTKLMVLAPWPTEDSKDGPTVVEQINQAGFVRLRIADEVVDISEAPPETGTNIDAVVDRLIVKDGFESRLRESIDLALRHGEGRCVVSRQDEQGWTDLAFTTQFRCGACDLEFSELTPQTFNFNSHRGACPHCEGLGSLEQNNETSPCPECGGSRLNEFSRSVTVADISISDLQADSIDETIAAVEAWRPETFRLDAAAVIERTRPELLARMRFLEQLGLGYLSLNRAAPTLSGGELQRARLAGGLGAGLVGVCHILDEPTAGLHAKDTDRLISALQELRDRGNTVIVVEHDLRVMRAADHVIEIGPGAGGEGGRLLISAPPADVANCESAPSARFLTTPQNSEPSRQRNPETQGWLTLTGASLHNLKNTTLKFPLGCLTSVVGVSGSGKSTLVLDTLVPAVAAHLQNDTSAKAKRTYSELSGVESLQRVLKIDQSSLGRSSRSNPATFSGVWDEIRRVFAKTREARMRGFTAKRFSFTDKSGQCPACRGLGIEAVDRHVLPDIELPCGVCNGRRFNPQTLAVRFAGRNVSDILNLRVDDAREVFQNFPRITQTLAVFQEVGLGYLTLGQSTQTLSGGECQRIRLATELARENHELTLFVLDEPSTGLHSADLERLLSVFDRLLSAGHTVLVCEHRLDVMQHADWLVELGPSGGEAGGRVIAEGQPSQFRTDFDTPTATALQRT
ncbi:excinuclease ABC subunit UvrA [Thalassoroseus pseudoceratinae]|uniref:excinuclease ABC subunit UvrA n=1 Tax=Thalassoroseus pseudoceratinae TaxID=2713176 RepID=UPI00141F5F00|nr:excinuclease ABC subunit UvrA [Thalassoroseus pseudoceratinae]